ncbi:MAG TPA: hypothetical protein VHY79_11050 [Rhizomicrobium sp.]|nr:hypothetical protein [Rhizomicrobium sp.]
MMENAVRVPGLRVLAVIGVDSPITALTNVAAYWAAIRKNEHAGRVLTELRRGVEERREMIRTGEIERFRAAAAAAQKAADGAALMELRECDWARAANRAALSAVTRPEGA